MALILFQPMFWLLLALVAFLLFRLARIKRLRWWPAWLLRLVLLALILSAVFYPNRTTEQRAIPTLEFLILNSTENTSPQAVDEIKAQAKEWQKADPRRVVVEVSQSDQPTGDLSHRWIYTSRLSQAFENALSMMAGRSGRIILATDGVVAEDELAPWTAIMKQNGQRLDILALQSRWDGRMGYIGDLLAPVLAWENMPVDVFFRFKPPDGSQQDSFKVLVNEQSLETDVQNVQDDLYRVRLPGQPVGVVTVEIEAEAQGEMLYENRAVYATLQVFESPRVLIVSSNPKGVEIRQFSVNLLENGIQVDLVSPADLTTTVSFLNQYQVVFIHNILAYNLSYEQIRTLDIFVRKFGGGLIFLGGGNSYSLGGYKSTLLEPLLPIKLEPPPRTKRIPVTFLLVVDRSRSMLSGGSGVSARPIDLAREGAMRAVETLNSDDQVGVLSFSNTNIWHTPIQPLGDGLSLRKILDAISEIQADSGTRMYGALDEALVSFSQLEGDSERKKVIILLSDGVSADGSNHTFLLLARRAREENVMISTIGLGRDADHVLLDTIARESRGRYTNVLRPEQLPLIMLSEREAAKAENIQTGLTSLLPGEPDHPLLFGFSPSMLPQLSGYNAQNSLVEEGAENILVSSNFGDPILAARQTGLGRVVAWMGDIGEDWGSVWADPTVEGQFWSQVIRYALPNPVREPFNVIIDKIPYGMTLRADVRDEDAVPVNFAEVIFKYVDASGDLLVYPLVQAGPGRYELELKGLDPGAYRGMVTVEMPNQPAMEKNQPFTITASPNLDLEVTDSDFDMLSGLAQSTGGDLIRLQDAQGDSSTQPGSASEVNTRDLWWRLILAMVLYWPLEIALRRFWLPWQ